MACDSSQSLEEVTLEERFGSRETMTGANGYIDLVYICRGSDDEASILAALDSGTPLSYCVDGRSFARHSRRIEQLGPDLWVGIAHYAQRVQREPLSAGETRYAFSTRGGTQHITQSRSTVARYPAGTAPDCKGAIGVTEDSIQGCDIPVPVYEFSITTVRSTVDATYRKAIRNLTGRVNDDTFQEHSGGECLYLGAEGGQRGDGEWELTHYFAASENETGLSIGDISGIDKKGWHYLWVKYKKTASNNILVQVPEAVYIEQLFRTGDFSVLGLA